MSNLLPVLLLGLALLLILSWFGSGLLPKLAFTVLMGLLCTGGILGALHAQGEPPGSIPWALGYLLFSTICFTLALLRWRRP